MSLRARIGIAAVGLAVVVGICNAAAPFLAYWDLLGEELVLHADRVPDAATGAFAPPEGVPGQLTVYASRVLAEGVFSRRFQEEDLFLTFVEGRATDTGYVSSRVAITEARYRLPFAGMQYQRALAWCEGSATFDGQAWNLDFTDAACARAAGRYLRWVEVRPAPGPQMTPKESFPGACTAYTECVCALAGIDRDVFAAGCRVARETPGADPTECAAAITVMRQAATGMGHPVPASCTP